MEFFSSIMEAFSSLVEAFPFPFLPINWVFYCPPNSPPPLPISTITHLIDTPLTSLSRNITIHSVTPFASLFVCWSHRRRSDLPTQPLYPLTRDLLLLPQPITLLMMTLSRSLPEPPPSKRNSGLIDSFLLDLRFFSTPTLLCNSSSDDPHSPSRLEPEVRLKLPYLPPSAHPPYPKNHPLFGRPSCRPPPKPDWVRHIPSVFVNVYVDVVFPFLVVVWIMKDAGSASFFWIIVYPW